MIKTRYGDVMECAQCGGKNILVIPALSAPRSIVYCQDCGRQVYHHGTSPVAIEKWNEFNTKEDAK